MLDWRIFGLLLSLVPCLSCGVSEIIGRTALRLKGCPRNSCPFLRLFSSRDKEGFLGWLPRSHDGLTHMAVFPRFMGGKRD